MTKVSGIVLGLGAGYYDHSKLLASTEAAMQSSEDPADQQAAVDAAAVDTDTSKHRESDPRTTPGYTWRTRTRNGIKERIQVPIGENAEDEEDDDQPAVDETPTVNDPVDDQPTGSGKEATPKSTARKGNTTSQES